jgi:RNA polymerase sigma factor (sigma-70 family)
MSDQMAGNFSAENDEDLLTYMSMGEDDPLGAEEAFAEFYHRHVGYVYHICKNFFGNRLGTEEDAKDLVQGIFLRVFEKAGTYKPGVSHQKDPARRVRAWMGTIAKRIFLSQVEDSQMQPDLLEDLDEKDLTSVFQPEPDCDGSLPSPRIQRLIQVLAQLPEREVDVLRVWAMYYKPGEKHQRLPDEVSQRLAEKWNTTPENIRQIRKRACDQIREIMKGSEEGAMSCV